MRVALVHDWLTGMRGGERILHELALLFPDADLYTLVSVPGSTTPEIERLRIHESLLSRIPGARRHYRKLLPLFPWAIEHFVLEGYDLVLSSSHAVAKGIRCAPGSTHVCYCFTPMRYIWDQCDTYLGTGLRRSLAAPLVRYLRRWDVRTSRPERVSRFIGISRTVTERIRRHYGRDADLVYPPVDIERIRPRPDRRDDFYLLVGGFVPYKREDLALEAFHRLGTPLLVVGDGPTRKRIARRAAPNVHFTGRIPDATLADLYARCRALVYPQEEDFGIVAVEAQAAGRPVIAYGRGGASETIVPLDSEQSTPPTGVFFHEPSADALVQAVRRFERIEADFDPKAIRAHAERFGTPRFRREISARLNEALRDAGAGSDAGISPAE